MSEAIFTCSCLNVKLSCSEESIKSCHDDNLKGVLNDDNLLLLTKPTKQVMHDWLLRDKRCEKSPEVKHCAACNSCVFGVQADCLVVPQKFRRTNADLETLRQHECYSECFQIVVNPLTTLLQQHDNLSGDDSRKDSLVPGYLESVRLKMVQVVKQLITERQRIIEEEHRKAVDKLRTLQTKCDLQCNTLLKMIEYQENAEERRFSSTKTKSCSSVERSESIESKTSMRSGGKDPALDDDVFEMQFNDEAIYEDGEGPDVEEAEEARELSPSDDEGVSTASQERTRRSSMDLSQYATSLPINVPPMDDPKWHGLRPAENPRGTREQSPAKPVCVDDIARSMRDLSDRMNDDHTRMFGDLPRPRLYTNHF